MITMTDKLKTGEEIAGYTGGSTNSFSESDPDFEAKAAAGKIDQEVLRTVRAAERGAQKYDTPEKAEQGLKDAGLITELRAKYKIEVTFGPGRTTAGPNLVGIQLWMSGRKLHGGGDELMFFCQIADQDKKLGCWSPIPADNIGFNKQTGKEVAICPKCLRVWDPSQITTMRGFRLPTRKLAEIIEGMFRQLESNADIYCKYHPTDIRYAAMAKAKGLETARKLKGMHMYRLHRIIKDTSAGASLVNRIYAFLAS